MNNREFDFMGDEQPDYSKMTVKLTTAVEWPSGEEHKTEVKIPMLNLLDDVEHFQGEYLQLMNFVGHDSGILRPNQKIILITRDNEKTNYDQN